jgi:hypothetical protein
MPALTAGGPERPRRLADAGAWDLPHLDWRRPEGGATAVRFALDALDPTATMARDLLTPDGPARVVAILGAGLASAWPDAGATVAAYCAAHGDALDLVAPPSPVSRAAPVLADVAGHGGPVAVLAIGDDDTRRTVGRALARRRTPARLVHLPTTVRAQADGGVGDPDGAARADAVLNDFELLRFGDGACRQEGLALAIEAALLCDPSFLRWIEHQAADIRAASVPVLAWTVHRTAQLRIEAARAGTLLAWPSSSILRSPKSRDARLERLAEALLRVAGSGGGTLRALERRHVARLLDALGVRPRSAPEAARRPAGGVEGQAEHRA